MTHRVEQGIAVYSVHFKNLDKLSQPLKVHLHKIFDFCFFSSKALTRSPDSYPKFVSNVKSNSPRYSNYSSLCVDSVNVELFFASNYIQTLSILQLILAPFEHFMDNFLYPIPLKAPELGYACFGWISLPHTESTRSETPRQLSQHGVRLHVN